MAGFAKAIIVLGIVLVLAGLILLLVQKLPFIGKLPGDIIIRRENYTFYFPLTTGIVISIIVSLILYLISRFK